MYLDETILSNPITVQVLWVDKNFVKAIYAKAESLYNTCNFEHALIFYHRGQVFDSLTMRIYKNKTFFCKERCGLRSSRF